MEKFKYKIIKLGRHLDENQLNEIGSKGWELINVVESDYMIYYYIKKRIN